MTKLAGKSLQHALHRLVEDVQLKEAPDAELVRRFAAKQDEAAFSTLLRRHAAMVLDVCRNVLDNREDAEDAFQATWLVLAQRAGSIRKVASVGSWLYGVAYRTALKARARSTRPRKYQVSQHQATATTAADELNWREVKQILCEELNRLSERTRAALVLCYLEGRTQDDAALLLGVSKGTLKKSLERGRALLRLRLVRRGLGPMAALLACAWPEAAEAASLPAALLTGIVSATLGRPPALQAVSGRVLSLSNAVGKSMLISQFKNGAVMLSLLGLSLFGVGAVAYEAWPSAQAAMLDDPGPKLEQQPQAAAPQEARRVDLLGDALPDGARARMGTVRLRHGGRVRTVAWSPDGKIIASGGMNGDFDIHLLQPESGRETASLSGATQAVTGLVFTPDGSQIISCDEDGGILFFDVHSGKIVREVDTGGMMFEGLALAPDGRYLATAGQDAARVWDVKTGSPRHLLAPGGAVKAVAYSSGGKLLACAQMNGEIRLWDPETGREMAKWAAHNAKGVLCAAFAPDGKTLASGGADGNVSLWNVSSQKALWTIASGAPSVQSLAFAPDGKTLAAGPIREFAVLLDAGTGKQIRTFEGTSVYGGVWSMAFRPDGRILLTGGGDHTVRLLDVSTGKELLPMPGHAGFVGNVEFAGDGRSVIAAGIDRTISTWDLQGKQQIRFPGQQWRARSSAFEPNGKLVATAGRGPIALFDRTTGKLVREFGNHDRPVVGMAWSADGTRIASGTQDGKIYVWDVARGDKLRDLACAAKAVWTVSFSPNGKLLVSGGVEQPVQVWNLETGKLLHPLGNHLAYTQCVVFSPDGNTIAGGDEGRVHLWDTKSGRHLGDLDGHDDEVFGIRFSRDGRMLATGSWDRTIALWELATREVRARFEGHRGGIVALALSPDERLLVSGSADSSALLWDLTPPPPPNGKLTAEQLKQSWDDLTRGKAKPAYQALLTLTQVPDQALPLLRTCLPPMTKETAQRVRRLIAQLDDKQLAKRQQAATELTNLGLAAEASLRQALLAKPSLESRQRLEDLLGTEKRLAPPPGSLRQLRALELLEHLPTRGADTFLKELAEGIPGNRVTDEARAALERRRLVRGE